MSKSQAVIVELFKRFRAETEASQVLSIFSRIKAIYKAEHWRQETLYAFLRRNVTRERDLWTLLDKKQQQAPYLPQRCNGKRAVIVGAGISGLQTAMDLKLQGADVVVVEKRHEFTRHNVVKLWPMSVAYLKSVGVKYFFPSFCCGGLDHIGIRRLQTCFLKTCLVLGVEVFLGCYFRAMEKPSKSQPYWNVLMGSTPPLHSNNNSNNNTNNRSNQPKRNNRNRTHNINKSEITPNKFRADIVIAADGCHSRVCQEFGFQQKTRGKKKLIGITCNFENRKTLEERRLKEFSLISFLNRRRFRELKEEVGIELENLVFLRDETLYFVYTPKISSLVERGVLRSGEGKPSDLLRRDNVNQTELEKVGKEIAAFCGVPLTSEYLRIGGRKDIQLFDFSERTVCNRQMMVVTPASYYGEGEKGEEEEKDEQLDHELFVGVVGDALLTPFWPLGTGANRAFLSGMDVSFLAGRFCQGERKDELLARRMMSRLMESSEETMRKDWVKYTIDPKTRYIC